MYKLLNGKSMANGRCRNEPFMVNGDPALAGDNGK
jgi:hypothetical protein